MEGEVMKVVTVMNSKGGVSKTTTAWHLAVGLAKRGYKVLLCDLDAQTNLSFTAGVDLLNEPTSIYDVFTGKASAKDAVTSVYDNLDIIPGDISLVSADRDFNQLGREKMLSKALKGLEYDYTVIDVPPSLGVMSENALTASDELIIPIQADIYGLQGISQLQGFIEDIRENSNAGLKIAGILVTRVNERTNLYSEMRKQFETVAERLGTKVFNAFVRNSVAVSEVLANQSNLFDEIPNGKATKDYNAFIDEYIGG